MSSDVAKTRQGSYEHRARNKVVLLCDSRESLVVLELLVALDLRDLVVCLVSVELLVHLESRERR